MYLHLFFADEVSVEANSVKLRPCFSKDKKNERHLLFNEVLAKNKGNKLNYFSHNTKKLSNFFRILLEL